MAFKKREKSGAVNAAQTRLAAMKEIDKAQGAAVDYGNVKNPCTTASLETKVQAVLADIETYNGLLAQADSLGNTIDAGEKALAEDSARALLGAQARFGRDSSEVEQIGGTRTSERAKRVSKKTPPAK